VPGIKNSHFEGGYWIGGCFIGLSSRFKFEVHNTCNLELIPTPQSSPGGELKTQHPPNTEHPAPDLSFISSAGYGIV